MSKIYLCGQITGLSYKDACFGWRAQVHDAVHHLGVECISPMRGKSELSEVRTLSPLGDPDSVMSTAKAINTRDRWDVQRSDIIFCNLLHMDRVSIGSMIEFGWADAFRIPILCCIERNGGNLHEHGMVQDLIGWRCGSLEEGIEVVKRVFRSGL
jgi:nucleoside 2-deoxyribosyltransferase